MRAFDDGDGVYGGDTNLYSEQESSPGRADNTFAPAHARARGFVCATYAYFLVLGLDVPFAKGASTFADIRAPVL